jgi:hypothetical protein
MSDFPPVPAPARFAMIEIGLLENNAWNPNVMAQGEFDRLVEEIQTVGFIDPIQVVPLGGPETGKFRIIGGEHRAAAARELRIAEVPAMVLEGPQWQDEDLQQLVTVRLNVLHGKLNPEKMAVLYNRMATKYGEEALQRLFAFTDQHGWDKMLSQIKHGLAKAGVPKEKRKEFDEKAKEAKTLHDLERILNELWSSYGDTMKLSFMIFTFGKREHIYVQTDKKTREAIRRVTDHCKAHSKDINAVLGPALVALADVLKQKDDADKAAGKEVKPPGPEQDDVEF